MSFLNLNELKESEIVPGFHARFVHSEHMTLAYWNIEEGATLAEHSHPHEQIVNVLEGEFAFTLAGNTRTLVPGTIVNISANVSHAGKALTACKIIDLFYPVCEDYKTS